MINFNNKRTTAVVYPCGICNLNCRYCTIDKNPALLTIDQALAESFEGDYYFNRIKEYFPRRDQLKSLETWGGEPFLHMERVYPLVHKLINYYPYFYRMHSSTNFSFDNWIDKFIGLMDCFAAYPYRKFEYELQLSVDGPTEINDANRGEGVTDRCIKNFNKLIDIIEQDKFPDNVNLVVVLKGTWDIGTFDKLNSEEKIIEFFQFYEEKYINKLADLNRPNIIPQCSIPNVAMPSPITQHDGKVFAEIVRHCREIEQKNEVFHYFKHYTNITPFAATDTFNNEFFGEMAHCGSGKTMVGFLPNNMISVCHEGFTLLADQYKNYAAKRNDKNLSVTLNKFFELEPTPMCLTDDEYIEHERRMQYINSISTAQCVNAVTLIIALAMAGLIEPQYLNEDKALFAAKYILNNTSFCIKANYATLGTFVLQDTSNYILFLNGALKYLTIKGEN